MNDLLSILRKAGVWIWNQKEKMVLLVLVGVLCFRVYVVYTGPVALPEPPTKIAKAAEDLTLPSARPALPRPVEFQGLVQRNPFTIFGMSSEKTDTSAGPERIDLTLERIVPWNDGSYRAEILSAIDGRKRRYEQGESFLDYRVVSIEPDTNTVVVYSSALDKNFTLKAQNAT